MTAIFQAALMLLASLLPQAVPRIDEQPKRVCLDAPRAIFQVENSAAEPILAILSVERWSDEGDTASWAIVQEDITQRQARPKQVRNVKLDARQRRNVPGSSRSGSVPRRWSRDATAWWSPGPTRAARLPAPSPRSSSWADCGD